LEVDPAVPEHEEGFLFARAHIHRGNREVFVLAERPVTAAAAVYLSVFNATPPTSRDQSLNTYPRVDGTRTGR
jgi:hypothetical protein